MEEGGPYDNGIVQLQICDRPLEIAAACWWLANRSYETHRLGSYQWRSRFRRNRWRSCCV
eukprot:scaffold148651_cov31-Tisochrysis_lutea.AAC.11